MAKRSLFVGGLDENVTRDLVQTAFIPFGGIQDVNIPLDYEKSK
jgi:peptidyl-prolyl isomerase E (cyclophilin E)